MGTEEDIVEVVHGGNNIENVEENKNFDRRELLYNLSKNRICESCQNFERCMSLGQSVRRCQACAKKKDLVEKKPYHDLQSEELIEEERLEMECDSKDEHLIIATNKYVMEIEEEHRNDNAKLLNIENFAVEHEHVDIHGIDVVKTSNIISSEDGKVIKKKESIISNKKEYKIVNALEPTCKKEKFGQSRGRYLIEKDTPISNERREQTNEMLDVQKTKEDK